MTSDVRAANCAELACVTPRRLSQSPSPTIRVHGPAPPDTLYPTLTDGSRMYQPPVRAGTVRLNNSNGIQGTVQHNTVTCHIDPPQHTKHPHPQPSIHIHTQQQVILPARSYRRGRMRAFSRGSQRTANAAIVSSFMSFRPGAVAFWCPRPPPHARGVDSPGKTCDQGKTASHGAVRPRESAMARAARAATMRWCERLNQCPS